MLRLTRIARPTASRIGRKVGGDRCVAESGQRVDPVGQAAHVAAQLVDRLDPQTVRIGQTAPLQLERTRDGPADQVLTVDDEWSAGGQIARPGDPVELESVDEPERIVAVRLP